MQRAWFILIFILLCGLACIATLQTGNSVYLFYAVLLVPVVSIINAARPRRGLRYAYWNRSITMVGMMLVIAFLGSLLIFFSSRSLLRSFSSEILSGLAVFWILLVGFGFFLWNKLYFMPAWGDWRFVRRYPRMAYTAHRLKQFFESYSLYLPLIYVKGKPYIVVGYSLQTIRGMATIDENGGFVKDEGLAEIIIRCQKLATNVLHMPYSLTRAKEIDSFMQTDRQMQGAFLRLRVNEEYFRAAGEPAYTLWKNVVAFEQDFHFLVTTMIERKNWQAQWALDHGLNRLVEISDEQLYEVESRLREFDGIFQKYLEKIDQVGADAEKLKAVYLKMNDPMQGGTTLRLKHRSTIMELFKSLSVFREASVAWSKPAIDFLVLDEEWGWWRARKAIAEKLEKELSA
ncbi:MAG: hypothetical protein JNM55_08580 [Anaerolineales bacterium]|nr:hypothetical protein [Anaerolineales bacterium]